MFKNFFGKHDLDYLPLDSVKGTQSLMKHTRKYLCLQYFKSKPTSVSTLLDKAVT